MCIKPPAVLDALYQNEAAISIASAPSFQPSFVWCNWKELVGEATLTNDEIRIMLWIQSLSDLHLPVAGAYCPLCRLPVRSWVEHLTAACVVFIIAAAAAFRAVLDVRSVGRKFFVKLLYGASPPVYRLARVADASCRRDVVKDQLATPDALVQLRFGCQQPSPFFPLSDPGAAVQMETTLSEWHVQANKDC